jgi:C-terminal processing protease CtpA/Prc
MLRVRSTLPLLPALVALGCAGGPSGPGSVGAVLGRDNETHALRVREVPEGLGADKAGLLPEDEIVMIDGLYVKDMGAEEVRKKLRGEAGTTVALTVVRGDEVRHLKVTRAPLGPPRRPQPKEERIVE